MGLMESIKKFRKVFGKPKPKTIMPSSKKTFEINPFNEKCDIKKYKRIYENGGIITEAIRCYALAIFSNGWRVEGEVSELAEDFLEQIDFDLIGPIMVTDALWAGDAYAELVRSYSGQVVGVLPRPPESFEIIHDEFGQITGYRQKNGFNDFIDLAIEDIFHLQFHVSGGSIYGQSLIKTAYDEIMRDVKIAESITESIVRHGTPKYHVRVGPEDGTLEDINVLNYIEANFSDIHSRNEFITPKDVEILQLDTAGVSNIEEYSRTSIERLCSALGVPEEVLGLGRGSTEATANVRLKMFYDKIQSLQRRFARAFNTQVFDRVFEPGSVKLVFNDPSIIDNLMVADFIAKIYAASPLDPIITREEARKMLGFENDEEEEEPWGDILEDIA